MPCTIHPLRSTDEADWRRLWTGALLRNSRLRRDAPLPH